MPNYYAFRRWTPNQFNNARQHLPPKLIFRAACHTLFISDIRYDGFFLRLCCFLDGSYAYLRRIASFFRNCVGNWCVNNFTHDCNKIRPILDVYENLVLTSTDERNVLQTWVGGPLNNIILYSSQYSLFIKLETKFII